MLGCHQGFGMSPSPGPRSKLHSLVRVGEPFLGADLPLAERRAQVLSRMPLAAPARSAGSSWTRPSTALCLSMLGHQAGGTGDRPRVGFTVTLEESIGYHRKHVIWRRCFRRCE